MLNRLFGASPATDTKSENKPPVIESKVDSKIENKTNKSIAPAKKTSGGLLQKLMLKFSSESEEPEVEEKKFNKALLAALEKVQTDCKKGQESLISKVIVLKYKIKHIDSTEEQIIEDINTVMKKLKNKKKYGLIADTTDYELFSKHISPVLSDGKKNIYLSATSIKSKK